MIRLLTSLLVLKVSYTVRIPYLTILKKSHLLLKKRCHPLKNLLHLRKKYSLLLKKRPLPLKKSYFPLNRTLLCLSKFQNLWLRIQETIMKNLRSQLMTKWVNLLMRNELTQLTRVCPNLRGGLKSSKKKPKFLLLLNWSSKRLLNQTKLIKKRKRNKGTTRNQDPRVYSHSNISQLKKREANKSKTMMPDWTALLSRNLLRRINRR